MIIDIFQDTICPWCRIGKKHLFDAIEQWEGEPITIRYRTYLLNHDTPKEGYPFREFMAATKGGPQVVEQMVNHVTAAGEKSGVPFQFDKVQYMPNTVASHTLIKLAPENKTSEVVEAIYKAYFEDGQDIGNIEVLVTIANQQGLQGEEVRTQILADAKREEMEEDLNLARDLQITGVPFFVVDGKLALSGAHPVETFLKAFHQVSSS